MNWDVCIFVYVDYLNVAPPPLRLGKANQIIKNPITTIKSVKFHIYRKSTTPKVLYGHHLETVLK